MKLLSTLVVVTLMVACGPAEASFLDDETELGQSRRARRGSFARRSIFGPNARIASTVADERGGRITVDDPANGGRPATFDLSPDGVTRAGITFSLDSTRPRFGVADLASLTEQKFATLEDSVRAEYGWIVYDFDGRVLDFTTP